jgi:hypothetical protein
MANKTPIHKTTDPREKWLIDQYQKENANRAKFLKSLKEHDQKPVNKK